MRGAAVAFPARIAQQSLNLRRSTVSRCRAISCRPQRRGRRHEGALSRDGLPAPRHRVFGCSNWHRRRRVFHCGTGLVCCVRRDRRAQFAERTMTPPIPPGSLWQPAGLPARCHLTGASPTADMAGEPASSPEPAAATLGCPASIPGTRLATPADTPGHTP
jgi:hypothetical protein